MICCCLLLHVVVVCCMLLLFIVYCLLFICCCCLLLLLLLLLLLRVVCCVLCVVVVYFLFVVVTLTHGKTLYECQLFEIVARNIAEVKSDSKTFCNIARNFSGDDTLTATHARTLRTCYTVCQGLNIKPVHDRIYEYIPILYNAR